MRNANSITVSASTNLVTRRSLSARPNVVADPTPAAMKVLPYAPGPAEARARIACARVRARRAGRGRHRRRLRIGRATAVRFADEGAVVAIVDRDAGAARAVAAEIDGHAYELDVRDGDRVAAAFAEIADQLGGLHVLVNNAGPRRPPAAAHARREAVAPARST